MLHFLVAAYRGARRAMVKDQGRPEPCILSSWELLAGEFPLLARRVGAFKVSSIIVAFLLLVLVAEVALNEATPGPFLTPRWRLAVALGATIVFVAVWTVVHAIRRVGFDPPRRDQATTSH